MKFVELSKRFNQKFFNRILVGVITLSMIFGVGGQFFIPYLSYANGAPTVMNPGGVPDYFGTVPNYANSQLPEIDSAGNVITGTGIRKFVDELPSLIVGIPDITTYPGTDYYEINLVEYTHKFNTDIPATKLRGYVQVNTSNAAVSVPSYLGPVIVAQKDRPVRIKFTNKLPVGLGGNLFLPVDTSLMGAGMGPKGEGTGPNGTDELYTQNRATLHLHGGITPWISDGNPHQWITPAGENTPYPKGVSVKNVPDMPDPGDGSMTFFYSNQQSARLMFYHDHAYGLTRLNVYAGEAAGYILRDDTEKAMIAAGEIPSDEIPLIIQDKTFVPKPAQLLQEDPTWDTAKWGPQGSLWFPHVYMPNQNPYDNTGANTMGRWDYGPWFWPPYTGLQHGPVVNPLAGSMNSNGTIEPPMNPGVPNISIVPESFMDTPVVNGEAYPYLNVDPKAYRFRILNAANDRFFNLQLYVAKSSVLNSTVPMWNGTTLTNADAGEVTTVPAIKTPLYPSSWPTDGREGGVPDPATAGPKMIQIGTEGGFLTAPAELPNQPVNYNYNRRDIVVLNISDKTLLMGPAERADVVIDFSQYAGKTLILYNDAPAPVPAFDPRNDYYTGDPDQVDSGGAPTTLPGYGPNTRTIMQIKVAAAPTTTPTFKLSQVNVVSGGTGYTAPVVTIDPPASGTTATATATGSIDGISIINGGSGYTSATTVAISDSAGGKGSGATAQLIINGTTGSITGFTITNAGSGYKAPVVKLTGASTSLAIVKATMTITAIKLTNAGSGYTADPVVTISDSAGTGLGASAVAVHGQSQLTILSRAIPEAFKASQNPLIVPNGTYVRIQDTALTFTPPGTTTPLTLNLEPKAIQELFTMDYGRMNATLGVELPNTNSRTQTTIPLGYLDPATEILQDSITPMSPVAGDGTQIWKITHNGVDTHAIHFHLFDVQIVNRVGWDGAVRPPDANEMGWKDTVKMNPLEDCIVAFRPVAPKANFGLPDSIRPLDPTSALGTTAQFTGINPANGNPLAVTNVMTNFGWEYVWHCHLLGHEENDMMRPMILNVARRLATAPVLTISRVASPVLLSWTDGTPASNVATLGNPANEIGFKIERALMTNNTPGAYTQIGSALANQTSFTDSTAIGASGYSYRVIAYNAAGNSTSIAVTVGPSTALVAPASPTTLAATLQSGPRVNLTFLDNATNEQGFRIERTVNGSAFAVLTTLAANANTGTVSYADTTVTTGNTYTYRVIAFNGTALSNYTNTVSVTITAPPAAPSSLTVVTSLGSNNRDNAALAWTDNSNNETGFTVQAATNANFTSGVKVGNVQSNVTSTQLTGLTRGINYYFRVRASNLGGTSAWSNVVIMMTP